MSYQLTSIEVTLNLIARKLGISTTDIGVALRKAIDTDRKNRLAFLDEESKRMDELQAKQLASLEGAK